MPSRAVRRRLERERRREALRPATWVVEILVRRCHGTGCPDCAAGDVPERVTVVDGC